MKSLLILPLLIIKALSGPVNDYSNSLSVRDDNQITPRSCFVDTSQYSMLNPNLIGNKLTSMVLDTYAKLKTAGLDVNSEEGLNDLDPSKLALALKNAKYLHIEYDTNKLCGLKISKNTTTGDFIAEYNSFSKSECATNSANNIICNSSKNNKCDIAFKCCNPDTMCEKSNAFLLKSVTTMGLGSQPIKNNNGNICTSNQHSGISCFTLAPMFAEEENNSQMQSGGQLNFLLRMLYIVMVPYALLK
jgi:hypothetical protein